MGHYERVRREGARAVVVDDIRRGQVTVRRRIWGVLNDGSPNATPIYIVGIQRSGTNMLLGAFAQSPEVEIQNESIDSRAFSDWALRDDDVIRSLIESSKHRCIIFKPLRDSHRVVHLMEGLGVPSRGRSIWIYRDASERIRSVNAKWPETFGYVGRRIAQGHRGLETGGLSDERLAFVDSLDASTMTPASGAALFWCLRNGLFFDLELDKRPDVALISYDRFVVEPERFMPQLCDFAGIPFRAEMVSGISRKPPPPLAEFDGSKVRADRYDVALVRHEAPASADEFHDVDPRISSLCADLQRRLDDEFEARLTTGALAGRPLVPATE